jgi:hypothetical protein
MAVGPMKSHKAMIGGNVRITLTDASGNVKAVRQVRNLISWGAYMAMASAAFDGDAITARYIYVWSGAGGGNPTQSMVWAHSGYGTWVASAHVPVSAVFNQGTFAAALYSWAVSGTLTFSGDASRASVDGAALMFGSAAASGCSTAVSQSWFAAATFSPLAITSVDKLTFVWAFSLSGTVSA